MIPKKGYQRMSSTVSTGMTHKLAPFRNVSSLQRMSSTVSTGFSHKQVSNTSLMVNNRYMGQRGELSQNFRSVAITTRDRLQLRSFMVKMSVADYSNNLIAQKRMEQKIVQKMEAVYGIDKKRMIGTLPNNYYYKTTTPTSNTINHQPESADNEKNLTDKVNGRT